MWLKEWIIIFSRRPPKSSNTESAGWGSRSKLWACWSVLRVAQLCLTLCNPMDCSMPGFPVHHQLPELTQTYVHQVGDASQPSASLLLPSIFPRITVFSNESVLCMRWPKYWSFSSSISPSNIQDWSPLWWTGWISLQYKGLSRIFSNTTVQKYQFFGAQLSLWSNSHIPTWLLKNPIVLTRQTFVGKVMSAF